MTTVKYKDIAQSDKKIDSVKLICSSIIANNNKFWTADLYESGTEFKVLVHWGRVGDTGQEETRSFTGKYEAEKFIQTKVNEKTRTRPGKESYSKAQTVETDIPLARTKDSGPKTIDNGALARHARKIATNPVTQKLIDYLVQVNVHQILETVGKDVTYNSTTGLFSTPLGIITGNGISEARDILKEIGDHVALQATYLAQHEATTTWLQRWHDPKYIGLLNRYLRIIPQKVGRKLDPSTLYSDLTSVQQQNSTLDGLQASLDMAIKPVDQPKDTPKAEESVFEVTLDLVEDQDEINRIKAKFRDTQDSSHTSAHLELKRVYTVQVGPMAKDFQKKGEPLGNIMELWHGTRPGNLLSIFKKGLMVPKSNAPHVTGRLFSDGVYGSDISTKSLNYASPEGWGNKFGKDSVFMFLCQFAMGKVYYASDRDKWRTDLPVPGHNSTWAKGSLQYKAGNAGVRHNEMIVPTAAQVNLVRLCEFGPPDPGTPKRKW
jgi:poly [ADP-ribose] polymerase